MRARGARPEAGLTLVEILAALAIAALIMAALGSVVGQSLRAESEVRARHDTLRQARFAMERMVSAASRSPGLLLPLAENPGTAWSESLRDPGVLALRLDPSLDRDRDGFADADDDRDGRIDEDPGKDSNRDDANGIVGIDDDGDGSVDEGGPDGGGKFSDDDEDGSFDEDVADDFDNDGDGAIGEDIEGDLNGDGQAGVAGVDDDLDGSVDEHNPPDDDEDGLIDEDPIDPLVFFLNGNRLVERHPLPHAVEGLDFVESDLADGVSAFRVERLPPSAAGVDLVEISLELTGPDGVPVELVRIVRVGGAL